MAMLKSSRKRVSRLIIAPAMLTLVTGLSSIAHAQNGGLRSRSEEARVDENQAREQESHESDGHRVCTLATLKGRYLFAASGVLLPPAFGVTVPTQGADAGLRMLNGDGTGTDTVTVRIGDTIVLENVVSPLSYTVNADCTGTIMVINGPSFDVFIAPDGSEFAEIATGPPGNYPAGIDRRVSRK